MRWGRKCCKHRSDVRWVLQGAEVVEVEEGDDQFAHWDSGVLMMAAAAAVVAVEEEGVLLFLLF